MNSGSRGKSESFGEVMAFVESDIDLMEYLMSFGIDEIRAGCIIGEMDCPTCKSRMIAFLVSRGRFSESEDKRHHVFVAYECRECENEWVYNVNTKLWEVQTTKLMLKRWMERHGRKEKYKKTTPRFPRFPIQS